MGANSHGALANTKEVKTALSDMEKQNKKHVNVAN
jgi:hypothetical protein